MEKACFALVMYSRQYYFYVQSRGNTSIMEYGCINSRGPVCVKGFLLHTYFYTCKSTRTEDILSTTHGIGWGAVGCIRERYGITVFVLRVLLTVFLLRINLPSVSRLQGGVRRRAGRGRHGYRDGHGSSRVQNILLVLYV